MFTCKEMLKTEGLEKIRLVAGKGGLDKIINWVHVIEVPEVVDWVEGGELLLITGVTIQDNKEALLKLVRDINGKRLSGLVINVGPYIKKTPDEVIELANSLNFPVFELPFEVKLIGITHIICREIFSSKIQQESMNSFMNELIFGEDVINDVAIDRAVKYGYDIEKNYYAIIVEIDDFNEYLQRNNIGKEEKIIEAKQHILKIIDTVMKNCNEKYMYMTVSDSFYLMIEVDKNANYTDFISEIARRISEDISKNINNLTVSIGIGEKACTLSEFRSAALEAKNAVEISKRLYGKNSMGDCRKLGVYKLFLGIENVDIMLKIYNEKLGKLKSNEKSSSNELLNSLEIYIDENRNIGNAAERLFIHRNTMKYRINKIEEILECDLKDDKTMFNIMLCLKIGRFLGLN
ncbi:PucR family transcriptional regulator [Clostridium thailandense]|nr:PucR family transcriptional regulator [Clostridium thailandense]